MDSTAPATSNLPPREGGRCPPQGIGASETNRSSQLPSICFGGCPYPGTGTSDSRWAQLKPRAGTARLPFVRGAGHLGVGCFLHSLSQHSMGFGLNTNSWTMAGLRRRLVPVWNTNKQTKKKKTQSQQRKMNACTLRQFGDKKASLL